MNNGYIRIPRSLLEDPLWINLPLSYQRVFLVILEHCVWKPTKFDDHGLIIDLQPGQLCISERELKKKCGKYISKNHVHRGIDKLKKCQFVNHKVNQKKSILTITHKETYELILNTSDPTSEPILNQSRTINEEVKKIRNKEKINKKEKSAEIKKDAVREYVFLTSIEYVTLLEKHGQDMLDAMLDELNSYKGRSGKTYVSDYMAMVKGSWVVKKVYEQQPAQKTSWKANKEFAQVISKAYHSEFCEIEVNGTEIIFIPTKGQQLTPFPLKYFEEGFKDQLKEILIKKGFKKISPESKIKMEAI